MSNMSMLHDDRSISGLWMPDGGRYTVGKEGIDKIEVYGEVGQEAYVPWFAIWIGGKIMVRVNAAMVESVGYAEGE